MYTQNQIYHNLYFSVKSVCVYADIIKVKYYLDIFLDYRLTLFGLEI